MVTTYNRKDLVSFGQYLLSKERRQSFENHPIFKSQRLEERLSEVHHADVENFLFQLEQKKNPRKDLDLSTVLKIISKTNKLATIRTEKGSWYIYQSKSQNFKIVHCQTGDSEDLVLSPSHLNSKEWIVYDA